MISFSKFTYFLAPMEDNSNNALRTLCYNHGADYTFTEMVRLQGLLRKSKPTWAKLDFHDSTPTIIQLLTGNQKEAAAFLKTFEPPPGFAGFNLNLGCPSPEIIKIGQGCALIKRVAKVRAIIKTFQDFSYPISLKIRLGMNAREKEKKVYLNLIKGTNPDFFIVHARHGGQKYIEPADFSVYKECVSTGKIIVANGDIMTKEQISYLKSIGVKGAMIGRAAVGNPAIFDEMKGNPAASLGKLREEYLTLAKKYGSPEKYVENFLKRLGRKAEIDSQRLI